MELEKLEKKDNESFIHEYEDLTRDRVLEKLVILAGQSDSPMSVFGIADAYKEKCAIHKEYGMLEPDAYLLDAKKMEMARLSSLSEDFVKNASEQADGRLYAITFNAKRCYMEEVVYVEGEKERMFDVRTVCIARKTECRIDVAVPHGLPEYEVLDYVQGEINAGNIAIENSWFDNEENEVQSGTSLRGENIRSDRVEDWDVFNTCWDEDFDEEYFIDNELM